MPKKIKSEEQLELEKAEATKMYMVCVWSMNEEGLRLYRKTVQFPVVAFSECIKQLEKDLLNTTI